MAEIQKRSRPRPNPLGAPPTPDETRGNLMEPEVAPAPKAASLQVIAEPELTMAPARPEKSLEESSRDARPSRRAPRDESIDGRTLRRTGRTEQFSTRVHPDFKKRLYKIAKQTGKNYNVILEESLDLYLERVG